MNESLPDEIADLEQLEVLLSRPTQGVINRWESTPGDVLVLGAGGKMGPSLTRMLRRATQDVGSPRRIIAVSRFSDQSLPEQLHSWGIETISGDLLDENFIAGLPETPNVIFMTGAKFGTSGDASRTWAMNVWLPSVVCQRFPNSRIGAFSTGNVYPLVPVNSGGSVETDDVNPVGEYGMSALGRERMFEYFSRRNQSPTLIARLNYAVEMRYGVLVDLAKQVLEQHPSELTMGYANVIWQGDANALFLQAMAEAESPATILNIAGSSIFSTHQVCQRFAEAFGQSWTPAGEAQPTALLNNGSLAHQKYGEPEVSLDTLIQWTANWLKRDLPTHSKPTHFEVRDGKF
ncbi:NAD(P)-dependent oxidoreductase [Thalassoglobus sp. JC818]|uniref:NAD-dependent epimerase/dehydratase family protein n=1 Tax=Thalassoglobus sp. JC818 TaxID=3232136 RepID=UPI0034584F9D